MPTGLLDKEKTSGFAMVDSRKQACCASVEKNSSNQDHEDGSSGQNFEGSVLDVSAEVAVETFRIAPPVYTLWKVATHRGNARPRNTVEFGDLSSSFNFHNSNAIVDNDAATQEYMAVGGVLAWLDHFHTFPDPPQMSSWLYTPLALFLVVLLFVVLVAIDSLGDDSSSDEDGDSDDNPTTRLILVMRIWAFMALYVFVFLMIVRCWHRRQLPGFYDKWYESLTPALRNINQKLQEESASFSCTQGVSYSYSLSWKREDKPKLHGCCAVLRLHRRTREEHSSGVEYSVLDRQEQGTSQDPFPGNQVVSGSVSYNEVINNMRHVLHQRPVWGCYENHKVMRSLWYWGGLVLTSRQASYQYEGRQQMRSSWIGLFCWVLFFFVNPLVYMLFDNDLDDNEEVPFWPLLLSKIALAVGVGLLWFFLGQLLIWYKERFEAPEHHQRMESATAWYSKKFVEEPLGCQVVYTSDDETAIHFHSSACFCCRCCHAAERERIFRFYELPTNESA